MAVTQTSGTATRLPNAPSALQAMAYSSNVPAIKASRQYLTSPLCGFRIASQPQSNAEALPGSSEAMGGMQRKSRRAALSQELGGEEEGNVDSSAESDAAPGSTPGAQASEGEESESGSEVEEDEFVASSPRRTQPSQRPAQRRTRPQRRAAPKLPLRDPSESVTEGVHRAEHT